MITATKTSIDSIKNSIDSSLKSTKANISSKSISESYKVDNSKTTTESKTSKSEDFKDVLSLKSNSKDENTQKVDDINKNETSTEAKDTTKIEELNENLKKLEEDSKSTSKDEVNNILTELLNLLNKLGIKEEDLKSNVEINSENLKTMIEGINGNVSSNSNSSSAMEKLVKLFKNDSVKDKLDINSLKSMEKLLSNLSANVVDDNTQATKGIKNGIKNLMSEISNMLDNKQNQSGKVLTLEDMLNKNYSQYDKESSTENESNNITDSKDSKEVLNYKKEVSKEGKFLSSLIEDDNDSSLNKINLFASRTQVIQNQGVDTVSGLTSNKSTFVDDLSSNGIKELTGKINPGNLEEITTKPIQEDVVTKSNFKDTELMNLLNKLGIKEEDIKSNGEINSDILQNIIKGINGDSTSNSNLSSSIEKLIQLLQTDSVKDGLDTNSLKFMQKLLSSLSANIPDDNTKATKDIKSGIKSLISEISNVLDNKQNQTEKVLTVEDLLNKNYSQDNKESSTKNQTNNSTALKESKKVSKEDKSLNSLLDDDKDSALNKINLFASRTQTIQNRGVDTVRGLTINKATFADDLIKDVKFMSSNALKELTVKINPGNLGEITIKLIQEDGVMKANLKANSKETTALLSQNLVDIKKQLSEQNIKIADVNIELYQGDTTFFKQQGFEGQLSQEQGRSNSNSKDNNINDGVITENELVDNIASNDSNIEFFA